MYWDVNLLISSNPCRIWGFFTPQMKNGGWGGWGVGRRSVEDPEQGHPIFVISLLRLQERFSLCHPTCGGCAKKTPN